MSKFESTLKKNTLYHLPEFQNPELQDQKIFGDIHYSNWFRTAHKHLIKDPQNEILCPMTLFIDGVTHDEYSNIHSEPIIFTLGIFNLDMRNKPSSWRVLGYIPNPENQGIKTNKKYKTNTDNQNLEQRIDYHNLITEILSSLRHLQLETNGIKIKLPTHQNPNNPNETKDYIFKFPLCFIIGDAKGNDKLCDRFCAYGSNMKYLCRDCDVPFEKTDSDTYKCKFWKRSELLSLSTDDARRYAFYINPHNAFDKLCFGNDVHGINGCTPIEPLHQFLLGIVKLFLTFFF